jgi:hypothetical protein
VARAAWTYRLETPDAASGGLEGYEVWVDGDDEPAGTVTALLERPGEHWLAIERGSPPLKSDLRAVRLEDVQVDHEALAVRLPREVLDRALELDPALAVRNGEAEAEARRVVDLPPEIAPAPAPPGGGPVDAPRIHLAVGTALTATFLLMGVVALATTTGRLWLLLLAIVPLAGALAGGALGYRAYRRPYLRHGSRA